jgi:hypothetical protein
VITAASIVLACATALAVCTPKQALAQSSPSLFPERYVACREVRAPVPAPSRPVAADRFVPLPRRSRPAPLPIAPLVVIDVAVAEPVPARASEAPRAHEPDVIASAAQDWRCVGFVRGKAGILKVLRAPPGSRFVNRGDPRSWRLLNARAASTARFAEALPELRRMLARPEPSDPDAAARPDGSRLFDALDLKLNAARALGDLDDAASAPALRAHLATREDRSYSLIWLAALPALARLDAMAADAYAAEVIARVAQGRAPTDPHAASDDTLLRATLPLLVAHVPEHLRLLQSLTAHRDRCDVLAARVRLGDVALRDELRAELATDLRTQRGVACYGELMPEVFPGDAPEEVKTLLYRHRMEAVLHLLHRGRRAPPGETSWERARSELRAGLAARTNDPDIAGGQDDRRFQPVKRVLHYMALAQLGDGAAHAEVVRIIRDRADDGIAPWIAAAQALRFGWPDAADLAAERLGYALRDHTDRYDTDPDPVRGFARRGDHTDVVDALAARRDARFALGLLDRDRSVREIAALHLGRLGLPETCDVVFDAAAGAEEKAVQDAFWALTMLGDTCREQAFRHAIDRTAPPHVRGMALELSAMMRDPRIAPLLRDHGRKDDIRPARQRARIIFHARE